MQIQHLALAFKANIKTLFIIFGAFLVPIKFLLIGVGICIAIDTILGIYAAHKQNIPITSRKLSQVVGKMVLYQSAVILFYFLEKYMLGEFVLLFTSIPLFLTKIVAASLVGIELVSANENYTKISGINLFQASKKLIMRAKSEAEEIKN